MLGLFFNYVEGKTFFIVSLKSDALITVIKVSKLRYLLTIKIIFPLIIMTLLESSLKGGLALRFENSQTPKFMGLRNFPQILIVIFARHPFKASYSPPCRRSLITDFFPNNLQNSIW